MNDEQRQRVRRCRDRDMRGRRAWIHGKEQKRRETAIASCEHAKLESRGSMREREEKEKRGGRDGPFISIAPPSHSTKPLTKYIPGQFQSQKVHSFYPRIASAAARTGEAVIGNL